MRARIYSQSRRPRRVVNDDATFRFADDPATLSRHVPAFPPWLKRTSRSQGTRITSRLARPAISSQREREENRRWDDIAREYFTRKAKIQNVCDRSKKTKKRKSRWCQTAASVKLFTLFLCPFARVLLLSILPRLLNHPVHTAAFQRTF